MQPYSQKINHFLIFFENYSNKNILLLFFYYLLPFTPSLPQTVDISNVIPKCKPAIISITTYDENDNALASGSGFFIDSKGIAISCYHVFAGAKKAIVKTINNKNYLVNNIISQNKDRDIIKFSISNELNEKFSFIKLDNSIIKEGESVFTIGNPLGLEYSISNGIISAFRSDPTYGKIIQITAPVSHGNSGSPLLNSMGNAIGIVTFVLEDGQNLNFAVSIAELNLLFPINALKYPPKDKPPINVLKEDIQRFKWGTSIIKVRAQEKLEPNYYLNSLHAENERMRNNNSQVICYDNLIIGEISTGMWYQFENNFLNEIGIQHGETFLPLSKAIEEFIQLNNILTSFYGVPENASKIDSVSCFSSTPYSGDIKIFNTYSPYLDSLIIDNDYCIQLLWYDLTNKSKIVLHFYYVTRVASGWKLVLTKI